MEIHVKHQPNSTLSAHENRARMLVSCPDGPGIVAAVSRFCTSMGPISFNLINIQWTRPAVCFYAD